MIYAKKQVGNDQIKRPFSEAQWKSMGKDKKGWKQIGIEEFGGDKSPEKISPPPAGDIKDDLKPVVKKEAIITKEAHEDIEENGEVESDVERLIRENAAKAKEKKEAKAKDKQPATKK